MIPNGEQKIRLFLETFKGRTDVYAQHHAAPDGGKGTYSPVYRQFGLRQVIEHLKGEQVYGVYPLLPDAKTWFLAIDLDKKNPIRDARALLRVATKRDIPLYIERSRSGNGVHLWCFFSSPVPAYKARDLGKLLKALVGRYLPSFDRFFPSQDRHTGKGLGNLIALPIQGKARENGNTVFLDPVTLEPQDTFQVLSSLKKVSPGQLDSWLRELPSVQFVPSARKRSPRAHPIPAEQSGRLKMTLCQHIETAYDGMPAEVERFLKGELFFENPEWHRQKRRGLRPTIPRFIPCCGRRYDRFVATRGVWCRLLDFARLNGFDIEVDDQRTVFPSEPWQFKTVLRSDQEITVRQVASHDHCVLVATTAAGKTVMATKVLADRGQPTLILVPKRNLIQQWTLALSQHLQVVPSSLAQVRKGRVIRPGRLAVLTFQSLAPYDLSELTKHFGFVIVDESHRVPADSFIEVVQQLDARYLLGLSATPQRHDGRSPLTFHCLGTRVDSASPQDLDRLGAIMLPCLIRRTTAYSDVRANSDVFQSLVSRLVSDAVRNAQIIEDIIAAVQDGHVCLVLSDRTSHCDLLLEALVGRVGATALHGRVGKKHMAKVRTALEDRHIQVLVSTFHQVGEGWDCPCLTALFLASPVGGKSTKLPQAVGRVCRSLPGKRTPAVYDYVDENISIFKAMSESRQRALKRLLKPSDVARSRTPRKARNISVLPVVANQTIVQRGPSGVLPIFCTKFRRS